MYHGQFVLGHVVLAKNIHRGYVTKIHDRDGLEKAVQELAKLISSLPNSEKIWVRDYIVLYDT